MTYDQYNILFIAALVMAGVFLVIAVILFFALRIPAVIGDLSGATARKAIMDIRNGKTTFNKKKKSTVKADTEQMAKITAEMEGSPTVSKPDSGRVNRSMTTAKLETKAHSEIDYSAPTEVMVEETALLVEETPAPTAEFMRQAVVETTGTTVSDAGYSEQTTVLSDIDDETSVLSSAPVNHPGAFRIRTEIMLFVSDEIITV
ncbi:hypothetical protein [uncultured Ruminococcus sp.]|uniref:hypothetical protein n=1 Tax=uncultured Ruminococcus sp. TaxID=165186 RepID=UPI00292E947D|nr:hypothetical protein [uncultured Ruminococcus sp.]